MPRHSLSRIFAAAALLMLAACNGGPASDASAERVQEEAAKPKLGLFTTLPIYWGEAGDIASFLNGDDEVDWVRAELETRFELIPLDTLETEALDGLDRVLLAQPRALAASENVALDSFLAEGNTAVILADPMLTRHSDLAFGDRRRPQEVVLLSPILARLGAELQYDSEQAEGESLREAAGQLYPVNLPGRFASVASDAAGAGCRIEPPANLLAVCSRGRGEAHLYADAALLDWEGDEPVPEARKAALWSLMEPLLGEDLAPSQN